MQSDMTIPRLTDIIARALDMRASAARLGDELLIERIDRLVRDKLPHARLCWQLGTLLVTSPSGKTYRVTNAGCSCPNGQKSSKRQCWHLITHELLIDLFETECDTADMSSDPPGEDSPLGTNEGDELPARSPWYARQTAARSVRYASI